jgi:hypothetical protein
MKHFSFLIIFILIISSATKAQDLIQITGVTMTSDSMEYVPFVSIQINKKDKGDRSNFNGVFSIVCRKGDTLSFNSQGYETKEFIVPKSIKGTMYNMVQFMNHDTFYLPTVIFQQEMPTGRDFEYALRYWDMDDDMMMVAKMNTSTNKMEYLMYSLPKTGTEMRGTQMLNDFKNSSFNNLNKSQINLLKVPDFINAWKRGELKRKDYK